MVLLLSLLMLAPFIVVGATIADNAERMATWGRQILAAGPPEAPAWIAGLPMIGHTIADYWNSMAHDTAQLLAFFAQYVEPVRRFAVASGASVLGAVLQLALSIFIAWFMFRDGHAIAERLRVAGERIAGERGTHLATVATATVRGVVLGILGTTLVQGVVAAIGFWIAGIRAAPLLGLLTFVVSPVPVGPPLVWVPAVLWLINDGQTGWRIFVLLLGVLAGIGFWIAGIKAAPLLGLLTFFLSPVPIGPPLVWVPAGLWLINNGETGWGLFVLAWGALVVSTIDNVIKPLIISRGSDLPFVLVLLGVLGGAVAFGFIGVFLGPVLLAVGYALLQAWIKNVPLAKVE